MTNTPRATRNQPAYSQGWNNAHYQFSLAKGVPDRVIMEVLGHAEIGVTMNTYAHVLPVLRQEAADAMDELFGG